MDYLSTTTFESKLAPGVVFKLKKLSTGRRMSLTASTLEIHKEIGRFNAQVEAERNTLQQLIATGAEKDTVLSDDVEKRTKPETVQGQKVVDEINRLQLVEIWTRSTVTKLFPSIIRWGVKSIDGLTIDGEPATVESFLENMPDDLIIEVGSELRRVTQLTFEQQMGFESAGTSSTQVTMPLTSTSVQPVDGKDTTNNDGVASSSPS